MTDRERELTAALDAAGLALENMIAWTAELAKADADFREVREVAARVMNRAEALLMENEQPKETKEEWAKRIAALWDSYATRKQKED